MFLSTAIEFPTRNFLGDRPGPTANFLGGPLLGGP